MNKEAAVLLYVHIERRLQLLLASLLFLEIVMHLFNPAANNIRTGRIQLFGTCIKLTQGCLIDTYRKRTVVSCCNPFNLPRKKRQGLYPQKVR